MATILTGQASRHCIIIQPWMRPRSLILCYHCCWCLSNQIHGKQQPGGCPIVEKIRVEWGIRSIEVLYLLGRWLCHQFYTHTVQIWRIERRHCGKIIIRKDKIRSIVEEASWTCWVEVKVELSLRKWSRSLKIHPGQRDLWDNSLFRKRELA